MDWWVSLQGNAGDLAELPKRFHTPEMQVIEENGRFYLKSSEFELITSVDDVDKHAERLLDRLNGIMKIIDGCFQRVEVHGVGYRDADGTRKHYVMLKCSGVIRSSGYCSIEVVSHSGELKPPVHRSTLEEQIVAIAGTNERVEKALRLFGTRELDWVNLYRIYEVIGESAVECWTTKKERVRFRQSANHPIVSGDDARHGISKATPPVEPMELPEAQGLIMRVFTNWIQDLAQAQHET